MTKLFYLTIKMLNVWFGEEQWLLSRFMSESKDGCRRGYSILYEDEGGWACLKQKSL